MSTQHTKKQPLTQAQKEHLGELLKEAIDHQIRVYQLNTELLELIAGADTPEAENIRIENEIAEYVSDWALDSETAEGIGIADAEALLQEIEDL